MLGAYAEIATRPAIVAMEAVGLLLFGWVVRKGRLHRNPGLKQLLQIGHLHVESEATPSL
jgi:hypothetical protein